MQQQNTKAEQDKKGSKLAKDENFKTDHRTPTPTPPNDDPSRDQSAKWVGQKKPQSPDSQSQQARQQGQQQSHKSEVEHSKSFGESTNVSGREHMEQDDSEMIPKENSFPQYKPAGSPKEKSQDYSN